MARAVANLAVSVTARTLAFERGMKRSARAIGRFSTQATAAKSVLASLSRGILTNPIAAIAGGVFVASRAFRNLTRRTEEFSRAMQNSLAIMGDVSDVLRTDMADAAFEVASRTKASAKEAADAYFFLASAGLTATQSIRALPVVASFAQAGMFDLAKATSLLADAQSALGLKSRFATVGLDNMVRVADVLVKANTLANASVEQFSEALTTKAGAALKILNKDIEEGVAILAVFADQGIKASEAGTALNIVLRELSTKAIKNANAFRETGIAVFDLQGNMRNVADIIGDIETAFVGLSDKQKKATLLQLGFSDKSVIFLQTLLGSSKAIREYEVALRDAGGTMADVSAKQLTPMQKGFENLGAAITETSSHVGLINTVLGGLSNVLGELLRTPRRLGEMLSPLVGAIPAQVKAAQDSAERLDRALEASQERRERRLLREKSIAEKIADVASRERRARGIERQRAGLIERGFDPDPNLIAKRARAFKQSQQEDRVRRREVERQSRSLRNLVIGLEDQERALLGTQREIDLYNARLSGATEEVETYIKSIHDSIDALTEQKKAQASALRRQRALETKGPVSFIEVSLSRQALRAFPGQKREQIVKDPEGNRRLDSILTALRNQDRTAVVGR